MSDIMQSQIDGLLADRSDRFREWSRTLVDHSRGGSRALSHPTPEISSWLAACRGDRTSLCGYLTERLGLSAQQVSYLNDWPTPGHMTLNEFANPPQEKEKLIAERLADITYSQAADPLFWTLTSLAGFRSERLNDEHARWLAEKTDWRKATRDALRRIGGAALEARGRLGVFVDHSVSRGWWRVRLAQSIADFSELSVDQCHTELRTNTWSELAEAIASKYTVACDPRLRAELVLTCFSDPDATQRTKRRKIERLARRSLAYCAAIEQTALSERNVGTIIDQVER